jgi:hypothetical protein
MLAHESSKRARCRTATPPHAWPPLTACRAESAQREREWLAPGRGRVWSPSRACSAAGGARARLTMYFMPPTEEMTLTQFESYATDRLRGAHPLHLPTGAADADGTVLKQLETLKAKGATPEEQRNAIIGANGALKRYGFTEAAKDNMSHFVLRLAFCGT